MTQTLIEGKVTSVSEWANKGWTAIVEGTDKKIYTVAFTATLRVPPIGIKVKIEANPGRFWYFAEKWEYIERPIGKTKSKFPVKSDPDIERAVIKIISQLNEFTVDDLHILEPLIKEKKRDLRVFGSVLRTLERKELIKAVRIIHSQRDKCHNRPVVLWTRIVDTLNIPK